MRNRTIVASAAAVLCVAACDTAPVAPEAARAALATAGQEKTELCHYSADQDIFVPITVADPAVDKHYAHGDADPGSPYPGMPWYVFGPDCGSTMTGAQGDVLLAFGAPYPNRTLRFTFEASAGGTGTFSYFATGDSPADRTQTGVVTWVGTSGDYLCFVVDVTSDDGTNPVSDVNVMVFDGGPTGQPDAFYWKNNNATQACLSGYDGGTTTDFGALQRPLISGDIAPLN